MGVLGTLIQTEPFDSINKFMSRKIGGTNIGYHFHVVGLRNIKKAQRHYPGSANDPYPQTTKEFKGLGYAPKPVDYPKDLIKKIKSRFEELIEDPKSYVNQTNVGYHGNEDVRRALKDPMILLPEFKDLIDQSVIDQIEAYFGSYFQVYRVVAWRNYHVPVTEKQGAEVYSDFWHFDQRSIDFAKLFVNISDVTEDDGPFHIQSRARSKELIKKGFRDRKSYGITNEEMNHPDHVVKATGPSGTGLYCNTELCFHRADIPKSGRHRDIIQFQFIPSSEPLHREWYKNPNLGEYQA